MLYPQVKTSPSAVNNPENKSPHITLTTGILKSTANGMLGISCSFSTSFFLNIVCELDSSIGIEVSPD